MPDKHRKEYLKEATGSEILSELDRRRKEALQACSDDELKEALENKPGYDGPRYVEK